MKNTLFVLLDGMEDDPNPLLDGKKPYEVAKMPFLYSVAPHRFITTGRGYTQLFLNEFFTGHPPEIPRAALEALGLGLNMSNGRTAYRLSPAIRKGDTLHWSYDIDDIADDIKASVMKHLDILEEFDPDIKFFVHGRSVLTMNYDHDREYPAPPVDTDYYEVQGKLGEFIKAVANDLDGHTVYPWGVGKSDKQYPPWPCIKNMTAVSDSPTALGVAASLGHKIHLVDEVDDRFPIAKEALKTSHVFLHIDEVDEYSHQKDAMKKIRILEHTDKLMSEYFSSEDRIVYFVDHGTSCVSGEHILMDVPLWTNIDSEFKDGSHIVMKDVIPTLLR